MTPTEAIQAALAILQQIAELEQKRQALKDLLDGIRPWVPGLNLPVIGLVTSTNPDPSEVDSMDAETIDEIAESIKAQAEMREPD